MSPHVRATWALRTAAEYRSAAVASQMLHWVLRLLIAPPHPQALLRLVADELDHAELSGRVLADAGGSAEEVCVDPANLQFPVVREEPLVRQALVAGLREYALHESYALEALRAIGTLPLLPSIRAAVAHILRDEARHRTEGWRLLDALLARSGDREWLRPFVHRSMLDVEAAYVGGVRPSPAEQAWGLLDPEAAETALARARRGVLARLRARSLDPR